MATDGPVTESAQLRGRGQLTLPTAIREALHAREGDSLEFTVDEYGDVTVRATRRIAADQAWFWTPECQAGERRVAEDSAAGRRVRFGWGEGFIAELEAIHEKTLAAEAKRGGRTRRAAPSPPGRADTA